MEQFQAAGVHLRQDQELLNNLRDHADRRGAAAAGRRTILEWPFCAISALGDRLESSK
jgi:hypothetical protein